MLMMKIKLFSNKKLMFYKFLLLKTNQRGYILWKILSINFRKHINFRACGTKDVEESAKKRKDPKTEVDDKGRVKGEKIEKELK